MDRHKTTIATYNSIAKQYQDVFMNLELYNDTYAGFCGFLKTVHPHILEIGCGPGNITQYLLQNIIGADIDAIDQAPKMIELAKQNNPAANCWVMDCNYIDQLKSGYDGMIASFCMPYLSQKRM